jgi:hypothetical protein
LIMTTFQEYQQIAAKVPIALRNDRDRIELPILGLQEGAGKLGKLLSAAFESGRFHLTPAQNSEIKDRLADALWCIARLCDETGISTEEAAKHGVVQIRERVQELDPDRR